MADAKTSTTPATSATSKAAAAEADAMPQAGTTTLDTLLREQAADNACGEVFTLAQALAVEPPAPDDSVVVVGGSVSKANAARVRGPGYEAKVGAALRAWAPWLDAALALGAHVAGGAVARAVCDAETLWGRPKDVDVFAADPAAIADALGAAVEAAFRAAPRDQPARAGVVEMLRIDTPHATTWVPEVAGKRLKFKDAKGYAMPYPVVQLIRLPCASVAACLGSFDLAPCQAAWTADGLRFSAAGARHYRRGYSLPDPARVGTHYLARLYKYHDFARFAVPAGTAAVRVGPCALKLTHQSGNVYFGELVSVDPAAPVAGLHGGSVYELDREREYASASLADLEADNAKALREGRPGGVARFEGWDRFERLAARIAAAAAKFDFAPAAAALGADLVPRLAGMPAADLGVMVAALLRAEMGRLAAALPAGPTTAELFARRSTTAAEMFVLA